MRFFNSIRRKLLFWLLVIAIAPSVLTGFFSYKIGRNVLEKYTYQQLSVTAKGICDKINWFLDKKKERIISFSSDGFIRDQTELISLSDKADYLVTDLSDYLARNKVPLDVDILETFVMDLNGEIVASSKTQHVKLKRPDADYFVNAKRYGAYTTDLHYCEETGEPMIETSRLLTSRKENSEAIGVIVNRIKGSSLVDLLRKEAVNDGVILSESEPVRPEDSTESQELMSQGPSIMEVKGLLDLEFTKTPALELPVDIYIVDKNNNLVAGSNISKDAMLKKIADTEPVNKFNDSGEETIGIYQNHLGNQVFGASMYIDEMGWLILVEEDVDKVFASIKYLRDFTILMKTVAICLFVILAVHVSKGFSAPIKRLLEGARRLSREKIGCRISVVSRDEIGELSGSFNTMIDLIEEKTKIIINTRDYLENILNNTHDVVITTDKNTNIVGFNTEAEQVLGYSKAEVIGKPVERFYSDRNEVKELIKRVQSEGVVKNYVTKLKSKQGDIIDILINIFQLKDNSDNVICMVSMGKDLIEKKKMESMLKRKDMELERLSITDNLTGLYNRMHLYTELEREMDRARRQNYPLSIVLFDIDKFKRYNRTHGHQEGDVVLQKIGKLVPQYIRHNVDSGYRYGAEEFVVIMPQADRKMALDIAERIRQAFEDCKFYTDTQTDGSLRKYLTISMGIEELKTGYDTKQFIANADAAMYDAKRLGGNTISSASIDFKFSHRELGSVYLP